MAIAVAPAVWSTDGTERDRVQVAYHAPDAGAVGPTVAPEPDQRPHRRRGVWAVSSTERRIRFTPSGDD